jgi:phosphate starvation-inducible membrane PsiE
MKKKFEWAEHLGDLMVEGFHLIGLFVIGAAIVWATWEEVVHIIEIGGPRIKDILLLFIYLELGAMVGIYFKTKHLPVRFLIYIAITALTRVLAIDIKEMDAMRMIMLTGAILLLSFAVVALRFASFHYPSETSGERH